MPKFTANSPEVKVVQNARFKLNEMLSVVERQKGEKTAPTTHDILSSGSILLSEDRVSSSSLHKKERHLRIRFRAG